MPCLSYLPIQLPNYKAHPAEGKRWGQLLSSFQENNRGATSSGKPNRALYFPKFLLEKSLLLPKTGNRGSQFGDNVIFVLLKQATACCKYIASHRMCSGFAQHEKTKYLPGVFVLVGDIRPHFCL